MGKKLNAGSVLACLVHGGLDEGNSELQLITALVVGYSSPSTGEKCAHNFTYLRSVLAVTDLCGNWMRPRACSCVFCTNQHLWHISMLTKAMLRTLV